MTYKRTYINMTIDVKCNLDCKATPLLLMNRCWADYYEEEQSTDAEQNNYEDGNSGITIDTSVLSDNSEVYTSLTDYGDIALFTTNYNSLVSESLNSKIRQREYVIGRLFHDSSTHSYDQYSGIRQLLFVQEEPEVIRDRSLPQSKETQSTFIIITFLMMAIFIVSIIYLINTQRRTRANATNIYTYD